MFDLNSIRQAKTIDEAVKLLAANPEAVIIAGGTDILVGLRDGKGVGKDYIGIGDVDELKGLFLDDDNNIHIRSGTTMREISESEIIKKHIPYFIDATQKIGGAQVRNMATIGGNISNGFTTADAPPLLLALGAIAVVVGTEGERRMPIEKYYIKPEVMDLKAGELLVNVIIPRENYEKHAGHYIKYAVRDAMDIALLGVAVVCSVSKDKTHINDIKIAFGAAAPVPIRAWSAEDKARGAQITNELLENIGIWCKDDISPITCKRAGKEFRYHLTEVLTGRALKAALELHGAMPKEERR